MKIKRILSATLAVAMLLCCCILTAFAENETYIGYYKLYLLGNLLRSPVQGNDGYKKQRTNVNSGTNRLQKHI